MKKAFVLSKGLDKFSLQEIKNMKNITGGAEQDPIYIPTGGGGRRCAPGQVWSDKLQRCILSLKDIKNHTVSL